MLPDANRMRRRDEFTATVRGGRRAGRPLLVLHLRRADAWPCSPPRVGFVVSRAVGSAVVRNRVRRRLRELMRHRLDLLPPGAMIVVRAHRGAATVRIGELAADLDRALGRALRQRGERGERGGGRR